MNTTAPAARKAAAHFLNSEAALNAPATATEAQERLVSLNRIEYRHLTVMQAWDLFDAIGVAITDRVPGMTGEELAADETLRAGIARREEICKALNFQP